MTMKSNVPKSIESFLKDNGFEDEEIIKFNNFFNCFDIIAIKHIAVIVIPAFWEFFSNIKTDNIADYDKTHFVHFVKYFLDGTELKSILKHAKQESPHSTLSVVNYYLGNIPMIIKEYQEYKHIKC